MTEQTESTGNVDWIASLLPGYVAGNLTEEERRQVVDRLAASQTFGNELENVRQLRDNLRKFYDELPGPSPDVFTEVKGRTQGEKTRKGGEKHPHVSAWRRRGASVETWMQWLFAPRWAPPMAMFLILGQAALLLWVVGSSRVEREKAPGLITGPVIERSVPRATMPNRTKIRLAFHENTREREIRAVIQSLKGRIVNGPSPTGMYVVEVPVGNRAALSRNLQALLGQPDVVRVAEWANP